MDIQSEPKPVPASAAAPDPLVSAIAAGDRSAERAFVERYQRGVRALVVRACRPGDPVVEDIVQDVLMTVLGRLRAGALVDANALPAYLQATIAHASSAEYRRRKLRGETLPVEQMEGLPDSDPGPLEGLHRSHLRQAVAALIEALPVARDREVLRGFYLQERDRDELCRALGIDEPHFRRVLHRARERLRELAEREGLTRTEPP